MYWQRTIKFNEIIFLSFYVGSKPYPEKKKGSNPVFHRFAKMLPRQGSGEQIIHLSVHDDDSDGHHSYF